MCLDADGAEKLRATLEALKLELKSAGFATLSPNRTDDIGERDEDFQPLNEMYQILQSSRNRSTKQILSMIAFSCRWARVLLYGQWPLNR